MSMLGAGQISESNNKKNRRQWAMYACRRCGGVTLAGGRSSPDTQYNYKMTASELYPSNIELDGSIPPRARNYLQQAIDTVHSPSASIMVAASSIDAMLKAINYTEGSLYSRIDKAATDHHITTAMAEWAHAVRLDANGERHADDNAIDPTPPDAQRCIDFAIALAQYLFVLPDQIVQGKNAASGQ